MSGILTAVFVVSVGVILYQAKMGYDVPLFPDSEKELNENVRYKLGEDKRELTIMLPSSAGEGYGPESSDPESLVLKSSGVDGGTYNYVFYHEGGASEPVRLVFSLNYGDMPTSFGDYTVTVGFNDDGTISSVGG